MLRQLAALSLESKEGSGLEIYVWDGLDMIARECV